MLVNLLNKHSVRCLRQHKDITRSWRMIGEDKSMAELPWASKESKNLVAASASRYASSA
jgi:hypothetical protein